MYAGSYTKTLCLAAELDAQAALFPSENAVPFGPAEVLAAARIYAGLRRPRGREVDIAIAATAIARDAAFWTLNAGDFRDIPGLVLFPATGS